MEIVVFLLLATALLWAGSLGYSRLLLPESDEDCWTVVMIRGPGDGAEQRVRSLMWLRSCGLRRCRVVLADGGMDETGRQLVRTMTRRWPELEFFTA